MISRAYFSFLRSIGYILIASATLVSCKSIQPPAPTVVTSRVPALPEAPWSNIQVPVEVDLNPYFRLAEKQVPSSFSGSEDPCEGVRYKYQFQRQPFSFFGKGNVLQSNIEGSYQLAGSYCATCVKDVCLVKTPIFSCGQNEPMRKVSIGYASALSLQPNYKLQSKTTLTSLNPIDPCKISFLNINITERLIEQIRTPLNNLAAQVDQEIAGYPFRDIMQTFWQQLQSAQPAEDFGYLYLQPRALNLQSISMQGSKLSMLLQIRCKPTFTLHALPLESTPLPNMSKMPVDSGFHVTVDIKARYDSLNKQLQSRFAGNVIEMKGKKIKLDSIHLAPASAAKMIVRVAFSGYKKGVLYLTGTPKVNAGHQFSIPDLEYDLKTRNLLLKSARLLLDNRIASNLKSSCTIDLNPLILESEKNIESALNQRINQQVSLQGSIKRTSIRHVFAGEQELLIRVEQEGKLSARIGE